jgi:hypothetical protein
LINCQTDYSPNNSEVFITNMKTLTTSTNPTAVDDRRLGRLRHQGLRLPLGLRPLLVGRRLGHNNTTALLEQNMTLPVFSFANVTMIVNFFSDV